MRMRPSNCIRSTMAIGGYGWQAVGAQRVTRPRAEQKTKEKALQKKTAAAKSKPGAKSASKASWTTDDVFRLLKAVNEETLKRMEEQSAHLNSFYRSQPRDPPPDRRPSR